jgi:hypothetical protein
MAINVGDAVLYFSGNTTALDAAIDKINASAQGKLQPASQVVERLNEGFQSSGQSANIAGRLVDDAGQQMERAGQRATAAFHETHGSLDLLTDQSELRYRAS